MKKLLFIFAILFLCGCESKTPEKPVVQVVFVINNTSYNLTEEAYNNIVAYLEYLSEYYRNEEQSEQVIETITNLIAEGFADKASEEVINLQDVETIIDEAQKIAEQKPEVPVMPGLDELGNAPLTVLAYLVANNNLDDDLLVNIGTMYDGLAAMDKQATLLVYWDGVTAIGANKATHLILKYETDGKGNVNGLPALDASTPLDDVLEVGEIVKEYSSQLSTSKDVMTKVLKDMVALSPTDRVGFVAGSHGSSWLHTIYTSGSRAFGQDGKGTDNSIVLKDIVASMSATGKKFDFLLFDACYMGSVEVCYEFKDVVDYQILSVMEVPAYGFPYDGFMTDLYKGNVEGYKQVCEAYIDYYVKSYQAGNSAWATISLIDSKEVSSLVSAIKGQITTHTDALADYNVSGLQEYGRSSGQHIAYDLGHFVSDLNGGQMPDAFKTQLDKAVLYKGCLEKARPASYAVDPTNYCGLGIYIPVSNRSKWNNYFKTLDWYTASGWNEVTFSWNF